MIGALKIHRGCRRQSKAIEPAVLRVFATLLIGVGVIVLTMWPDRVAAQGVRIESGKTTKPKRTSPKPNTNKSGGTRKTPRRTVPEIEVVHILGGSFLMGSTENEPGYHTSELPQHLVTVPSFSMGKYEVTQAQWRAVMGNNPSHFKGDNLPVANVSWYDARKFCERLSELTGKHYRLPSEAEWEYAARAGTTDAYASDLDAIAWYEDNSGRKPRPDVKEDPYDNFGRKSHPVGQKQANKFGLFDILGNVWEWCEDVWVYNYGGAPTDGSAWLGSGNETYRVTRGGSTHNNAASCRYAHRSPYRPADYVYNLGFRVVEEARIP